MNINPVNNSCNFGKSPIFNCTVKRKGTNQKEGATLYIYDKRNPDDRKDIRESNLPVRLRTNFDNLFAAKNAKFYCLQTDGTQEFVSAAQTSRHYKPEEGKYGGLHTIIDEYGESTDFVDPATPLLAHIAKTAMEKGDGYIATSFRAEEAPSFKNASFSETKYENWVIPERRFVGLIDRAEKRAGIEYIV